MKRNQVCKYGDACKKRGECLFLHPGDSAAEKEKTTLKDILQKLSSMNNRQSLLAECLARQEIQSLLLSASGSEHATLLPFNTRQTRASCKLSTFSDLKTYMRLSDLEAQTVLDSLQRPECETIACQVTGELLRVNAVKADESRIGRAVLLAIQQAVNKLQKGKRANVRDILRRWTASDSRLVTLGDTITDLLRKPLLLSGESLATIPLLVYQASGKFRLELEIDLQGQVRRVSSGIMEVVLGELKTTEEGEGKACYQLEVLYSVFGYVATILGLELRFTGVFGFFDQTSRSFQYTTRFNPGSGPREETEDSEKIVSMTESEELEDKTTAKGKRKRKKKEEEHFSKNKKQK